MKIVLASNNAGKLFELQALFAPLGVELVALVFELALPSFLPQALNTRSPLKVMLNNGRIRVIISVSPPRRPVAGSRREIPPGARHWCHALRRKAC